MSQPVLSGEQLAVEVVNGVLRVTNDPGFSSDNGDGCPYRSVLVTNASGIVFGQEVGARTPADQRWPGFFSTRSDLAMWRLALQPGTYALRVYGGTFFKGWGDVPDDYIEWGITDQGKNPSGVPRENRVNFEVPSVAPPPPPPAPTAANGDELVAQGFNSIDKGLYAWQLAGVPEAKRARTKANLASHIKRRKLDDPVLAEIARLLGVPW